MKLAIDGADRPSTNNVLEQLLKVILDFCKKVSINHGADVIKRGTNGNVWYHHWYPTAHAHAVGQYQDGHQIQLWPQILLGHACHPQRTTMVHDATLLQIILKELAGNNGVQVLNDAPAPGTGTAHLVAKLVSYLQAMLREDTNSAYTESAYGVSSDINLSEEEPMPRARKRKKSQGSKSRNGCGKQKKDKDNEPKKNTCPTARSSIARSLIKSNLTSACGTRNIRATTSN
jgi:hypothetical protein